MGDCGCGTKSPLSVVVEFRQPNSTITKVVHGGSHPAGGIGGPCHRGGEPPQAPSFSQKRKTKFLKKKI
jgi:hypothetical protein